MKSRLTQESQETEEMARCQEELERQWDELEQTRQNLLPEANKRRMILVETGPYIMGGRGEESPNNERPSHTVYEWCHDYYDEEYYRHSPASNPRGPEGGQERVVRGGSYQETRASLRCTRRNGAAEAYNRDTFGFRIAMSAEDTRR